MEVPPYVLFYVVVAIDVIFIWGGIRAAKKVETDTAKIWIGIAVVFAMFVASVIYGVVVLLFLPH